MTAPALAAKLRESGRDESLEPFVDEVAHLVRSQVAGIVGNLVAVAPLVLAVQLLAWGLAGAPLAGRAEAVGGCCRVESKHRQGTRVIIEAPHIRGG